MRTFLYSLLLFAGAAAASAQDGDRFAYLDEFCDPYYVHRTFPKLTTPQWVGEEGIEAVVVLAIDDMRDPARYETFLRPILERLQRIDGRAPVSIMTCQVNPQDPQLQTWLKEGLSLEIHTYDHPCPCLQNGDFAQAKGTYERCVDLLASVPGNKPVAFRMPCCDSKNTPSPRFWAEIFNGATAQGNYLTIDSSVFNVFTPEDPALPRDLVTEAEAGGPSGERERFRKYIPFPSFVNTIENYPYPYVIGRLCWQFPCMVPSDWEAQNLQRPNNPETVRDMKLALDATVLKQGVFNLVFHPHGWIRSEQVVELIDHAVEKYGPKVKFLTFGEAQERLDRHLLAGQPLRNERGGDNGVRLLDLNGDGYLDVVIGNDALRRTRIWSSQEKQWRETEFPTAVVSEADARQPLLDVRFGVVDDPVVLRFAADSAAGWRFKDERWAPDERLVFGDGKAAIEAKSIQSSRLRDLDGDGCCELIVQSSTSAALAVYARSGEAWRPAFDVPQEVRLVDANGQDAGLRLVDLDRDGDDDLLYSNESRYSLHLFESLKEGWSREAVSATRGEGDAIPMIARQGASNGAWFHSAHLWIQNEDTARLPDGVDRRSFVELRGLAERQSSEMTPSQGDPRPRK